MMLYSFNYGYISISRSEPRTVMMSSEVVQIYTGKILKLLCLTTDQDIYGPPSQLKWAINGIDVDFRTHRGGLNIETFKRRLSTTSKLTILNFQHQDGGVYECKNMWESDKIDALFKVSSGIVLIPIENHTTILCRCYVIIIIDVFRFIGQDQKKIPN